MPSFYHEEGVVITKFMRHYKPIIILFLIVTLPLMLLAWQGWKMNQDEQQLNSARFDSLISARVDQIDTLVQGYFEEMQVKWSLVIPQLELDSISIRKLVDNDGSIRQIFVIDSLKKRQFPPTNNDDITASEKNFVKRLQAVWHDPEILFSNQVNTQDLEFEESQQEVSRKYSSVLAVEKPHFLPFLR